jgi:hypothetical protein
LLSTENDWKKLRNGIGIFRDLARRRQLAPFIAVEIGPGADVTTDPQLEAYTRKTARRFFRTWSEATSMRRLS